MSVKNRVRDRLSNGRIKSYRRVGAKFPSCARFFDKSPGWFRNMMGTRPERRMVKKMLNSGADPDAIAFPVRKRAAVYWW
ncbi:hypothetical protein EXT53_18130 [Pectobacterium polaris]|uniref:Uncharacterized protein n=1 Tax=Pectobacterium polaris TaxID=2042057 RepID=A0AAW5GIA4_9GAMM|nr:hypothetical protein [Pectobacterium polaris]MCL6353236.1 hypothetical protein [Pectobacterium polaris]MCL6370474.1 hypothetical protein [Pectobacterium polaris]